MIKLYYSPGSCSLASHIALEEAGAEYTAERLNFAANQQQSPEYKAINPKGRVPAMVTDRGVLTETPAILAFIAQSYPKAKLAPLADAFAFAQMQAFNSYLCSTVHVAHAHKGRGTRWADDPAAIAEMKRKVPESVGACFDLIEKGIERAMGDGRRLHRQRSLSLHAVGMDGRRRPRSVALSEGDGSSPPDAGTAGRAQGDGRR